MLKSLSTPTKDAQNTHATLSCKCCLHSFPSQPIFWSTAHTLPLLPHLSLTHHQIQHHFWPQVHPHFSKQYWHRSPKTSNLSEPVDMSRSSFGTSLRHMTLQALIPCFPGLFPPVHSPGLFSLTPRWAPFCLPLGSQLFHHSTLSSAVSPTLEFSYRVYRDHQRIY